MHQLVSVIIPCFNQAHYIAKALKSVQQQTYTHWECIVVNDGSQDQSEDVIKSFIKNDPRIQYIHQENAGVAAARNSGFLKAKGHYIQFLDGDDWLHPDKLKTQVDYLDGHISIDIVYCNHLHYYEQKDLYEQYTFTKVKDLKQEVLYEWDRAFNIPPHTPLYRASIWSKDNLPYPTDYNLRYEDWVFWALLGLRKCTINYQDKSLAYYRVHGSNFTSNYKNKAINALLAANYISQKLLNEEATVFLKHNIAYYMNSFYAEKSLREYKATLSWKLGKKLAPLVYKLLPGFIKDKYKITIA
jgi:glycosyltransferase involved in cell wall biosynthesis